ncbi:MAG: deoxyribodipyrimidine photo-lyase [Parachlamydiales bacterium]|jgi:deoxyribodipyrimidine photo-lyase
MMKKNPIIVWFRQDLRLLDNEAFYRAAKENRPIIFIYIHSIAKTNWHLGFGSGFWLKKALEFLSKNLSEINSKLYIFQGNPGTVLESVIKKTKAEGLYFNWVYEPDYMQKDKALIRKLINKKIDIKTFHSCLLFNPDEIKTKEDHPYKVFTQFWNCCLKYHKINKSYPIPKNILFEDYKIPSLGIKDLILPKNDAFEKKLELHWTLSKNSEKKNLNSFISKKLKNYSKNRNFPFLDGTSKLSAYLHFGQISPKVIIEKIKKKSNGSDDFIKEIGWREFSKYIMYHFPQTESKCFKEEFLKFPWNYNKKLLSLWQQGRTGYPIIDAAINQLIQTGWMHNRCRMIVASFLIKDLLQPWQEGAKFFYRYLVDADLASNNMGWQWSSGCGADAAPFFRIFNPILQSKKFDPEGLFIKKYLPELKNLDKRFIHFPMNADLNILKKAKIVLGKTYPYPIIDIDTARKKALKAFRKIVKKQKLQ